MYLPFQVLNLFLALLLSSFGASNLSAAGGGDDDTNKLSEAFSRIGRFIRWIKRIIFRAFQYLRDRIVECFRQQMAARRGRKPKDPGALNTYYDCQAPEASFLKLP
jgi:hypothetical protein